MERRSDGPDDERFDPVLEGLDPSDPEVQAFAEHLDRMQHPNADATVEGTLRGVDDFAQSINRTTGHRRTVAVFVVALILFGVIYTVWNAVLFMLGVFFG